MPLLSHLSEACFRENSGGKTCEEAPVAVGSLCASLAPGACHAELFPQAGGTCLGALGSSQEKSITYHLSFLNLHLKKKKETTIVILIKWNESNSEDQVLTCPSQAVRTSASACGRGQGCQALVVRVKPQGHPLF